MIGYKSDQEQEPEPPEPHQILYPEPELHKNLQAYDC
jgi:hypothetical protein